MDIIYIIFDSIFYIFSCEDTVRAFLDLMAAFPPGSLSSSVLDWLSCCRNSFESCHCGWLVALLMSVKNSFTDA